MPQVISESDVRAARRSGFLSVPEGALVTPLAREEAARLRVELGLRPRTPRARVVIGNWKMNLGVPEAVALLERLAANAALRHPQVGVAVLPSYPYLVLASALLAGTPIEVGAQDISAEAFGAFTGDVSVGMLRSLCTLVLVGHSERRRAHGEASDLVWRKASVALSAGLKVVVCVGETAQQRDRGRTTPALREQMAGLAKAVPLDSADRLLIAYEPVWAIGANRSAGLDHVEEAHREIRRVLVTGLGPAGEVVPILYGGSVQPQNAAELAGSVTVDGFLVGGASLDDAAFAAIAGSFPERRE